MTLFDLILTILLAPVVIPILMLSWFLKFLKNHPILAILGLCMVIGFASEQKTTATPETAGPMMEQPDYFAQSYISETEPVWTETQSKQLYDLTVYNQDPVDPVQASLPWSHRNGGVCRNLTENASAMVIFVEDSQSRWTQWEMQNYLDTMISPGFGFIENNAASYGYDITLEWIYYVDDNNKPQSTAYNGTVYDFDKGYTSDLIESTADIRGYGSPAAMLESARMDSGNDQIAYIFVLDKPGRSYAHWYSSSGDYLEYAVLFTSQNGYQMRPDVVAHEMMHLFGAEDMYAEGSERVSRAAMAQRFCPNELFLNPQWNLYDNQVSTFTAYTVGWLDAFPEQYRAAEWWS